MSNMLGRRSFRFGVLPLTLLMLVFAALSLSAGCGEKDGVSGIDELLKEAQKAGEAVQSYHMVLSMSYENEPSGSVKTEELVIDIDGEDVQLKDTFFDPQTGEGMVIQEAVRVGDKQYKRDFTSEEWVEEPASLNEEAASTYTAHITDFASNSSSREDLGEEEINGVTAVHVRFVLSPEDVLSLMTDIPQSNLSDNAGGQVDIWIARDTFYPVRYELLFRNVMVAEDIGNADVKILIDITGINQPIDINPPTAESE